MIYRVKLRKPWCAEVDGKRMLAGFPLPPGDNWLQRSDGRVVATTYQPGRAIRFKSVKAALADRDVKRARMSYGVIVTARI